MLLVEINLKYIFSLMNRDFTYLTDEAEGD